MLWYGTCMQDSRDVNEIAQMLLDTISDTTVCSLDSYKITSSDNDIHNILFTHRYKNSAKKINKLYSWTFNLANMNTQNDLLLHNASTNFGFFAYNEVPIPRFPSRIIYFACGTLVCAFLLYCFSMMLWVAGILASISILILIHQYCAFGLNQTLYAVIQELRADLKNCDSTELGIAGTSSQESNQVLTQNKIRALNLKLHSKLINFCLQSAHYFLLDIDSEAKAFLLYCHGRVNESFKISVTTEYKKARELTHSEQFKYIITRRWVDRDARFRCTNASEICGPDFSKETAATYFLEERAIIEGQLRKVESRLLEHSIYSAYDNFNKINPPGAFLKKIYPRLSARYYQLQAAFILLGGLVNIDQIDDDRFSLTINILEKITNMLGTFEIEATEIISRNKQQMLEQYEDAELRVSLYI